MNKYAESKEYHLAYAEMVRAAQYGGVTTYQEIARLMGLPTRGSHMASEVGKLLGEISENERRQGRPMLSAVVVGVSGVPGSGFFWLARELGKLTDGDDEEAFWRSERDAVYNAWRRTYR